MVACIPRILRGKDVVVAAETGSGKTHAYLVLLIHKLGVSAPSESVLTHNALQNQEIILVLCPNAMLCDQVVGMANSLLNQSGKPLVKVAAVCGQKIIRPIHMLSFDEKLLSRMADVTEEPKTYETDEPQEILGLAKLTSVMKMTLKTRNF
ncbi:DEAD-box ATP-dependent RNA helicase 22 [Carex littledalei]|uniref:ATP-dependent RNA helicase n=1 Tax=Carex littledalei TaxID=544730 RepID=A0A833R4X7_9POAL|nr:DEAD-box ATP-dependent RNA helicase 22 [Carex littledalei]